MNRWSLFVAVIFCSSAFAITPSVEVDPDNGEAETIRNLDINGTLYNASFDHAFGADLFEGDPATANDAVDAIVAVLNTGYDLVDNGSPPLLPIFVVSFDDATNGHYSGCRSQYVPFCDDGIWANAGEYLEDIGAGARVYFEVVTPVAIDVLPGDSANKVYPNKTGQLPVAVLSAPGFDATQVDPATLKFGSAEASVVGTPTYPDVDGQSGYDIVNKYRVEEVGILCNDTEVSLYGETFTGEPFAGAGDIDATECQSGGCHPY